MGESKKGNQVSTTSAEFPALPAWNPEPSNQSAVQRLSELLTVSVRCSLEERKVQSALRNWALTDELTGLCSRRGFLLLADQQRKLAYRTGRPVHLFLADVDELKRINDTFGHREGDHALTRTATVLRNTFRDSDILGRYGGDEFAIFTVGGMAEYRNAILKRLHENLDLQNAQEPRYHLSLSIGKAWSESGRASSLEDLLSQADGALYEQKRSKNSK